VLRPGSLITVLFAAAAIGRAGLGDDVDFARDIRPILANYCYDCHGPDDARRRANLRFDTQEGWSTLPESGKLLVVAGQRDQSELWRRVSSRDDKTRMPAAESGKRLAREEIEKIGKWIDAGGEWSEHWAYVPPVRRQKAEGKSQKSEGNAIDRFLPAKLVAPSLAVSTEAEKGILLRRLSLDLTGIPPTLAELGAFLEDRSPNAYEWAVDRLLASPRFGERMAQDWLDLGRYADTHGYHSDSQRDMWRWRDWVIDAFNRNMPLDQFTIEQLAGDLLPGATLPQRIATGFHRNNMVNFENGAIAEEYRTEYVIDRVVTTGTVWLGQTWLCARCHDHKYDPISQRDFYRLFAYFNNVPENGLDGRSGNAVPYIAAPTGEQQHKLDTLAERVAQLDVALKQRAASCDTDFAAWQREKAAKESSRLPPGDMASYFPLDEAKVESIKSGQGLTYVKGKFAEALLFDGETHLELGDLPAVDRDFPLTLSLWIFPTSEETGTLVARVDDAFTSRGFTLALEDRRLVAKLRNDAGNEIVVATKGQLPLRQWQHVAVTYDGAGNAAGMRIWVDGHAVETATKSDSLASSAATRRPWQLGRRDKDDPFRGLLDELRMYARALAADEISLLAGGDPISEILAKPQAQWTPQEAARLRRYYLEHHDVPYRELLAQRTATQREQEKLERAIPTTMVMQELDKPRDAFVLERGLYNRPKQKVSAGVPEQFLAPSEDLPPNRLGLAQWLVDRNNPLTARVLVNRYWSHFFGRGLVATPEDFGVRGSPPSHPELLDTLAVEFMESGWDVKCLVRLIVTSEAYREAKSTKRLSAEEIRDSALAVSGLLCERVGGPSVNPYQPADLWKDLAYDTTTFSAQTFHPSRGADLYRRSVYTFWKRTAPHPLLAAFDAPNRETCSVERPRTNSPMQALALLNDVTFVEASRALAQRMIHEAKPSTPERIDFVFRTVLSRKPTTTERARLTHLYDEQLKAFQSDPKAASELVSVGESPSDKRLDTAELAAWTTVVQVLFNLEEFVMK